MPCARESLMFGIASGLLIGAGVFLKTSELFKSISMVLYLYVDMTLPLQALG